ncbi:hypothetical protein [Paenibacillus sp. IHBB 10380]|uniref:hypothetical protein n=1 Tax=Paenibacillus sp. IHBB 10380 TaxID=1566358 RepID=UPI0005CFB25F|nr:hypothetical protein [Paenibacillus sp. IHBB 10380]AJS59989.1 hypothetical protein UB51_17650 [Paenibacillus sp. IHBB 10380]
MAKHHITKAPHLPRGISENRIQGHIQLAKYINPFAFDGYEVYQPELHDFAKHVKLKHFND